MDYLPSRKEYQNCFSKNHLLSQEQRENYKGCKYRLCFSLDLMRDMPSYTSLKIDTYRNRDTTSPDKEIVILSKHLSRKKKAEAIESIKEGLYHTRKDLCHIDDIKHFGELLFILAAKLKYDLIIDKKTKEDNSGFLHTKEIKEMNPEGLKEDDKRKTYVGKSLYGTLRKLYDPEKEHNKKKIKAFTNAFLFEPEQLYHLVCYIAKSTDPYDELLFWWLNISAKDISFKCSANGKEISGDKLKSVFGKLFEGCLLGDELSQEVKDAETKLSNDQSRKVFAETKQQTTSSPIQLKETIGQDQSTQSPKLKYLKDFRDVLKFNGPDNSKWFRKTGPIAIDFAEGCVYECKEIMDKLGKLVFSNGISILEGHAGSGKSVLIRQLAYNHIEGENQLPIYYYSFKLHLPISDFDEFKNEINAISGVVIIEDIHLVIHDMQCIIDDLAKKDNCNILLTTRPAFRGNMLSHRSNTISKLPSLTLDLYKEKINIDELIDYYIEHNSGNDLDCKIELKHSFKEISKGNLWLLSYAIKGCMVNEGITEPVLWIREGVRSDLEDIRRLKCNPQILIALSPLYIKESLTANSFLAKNFDFADEDMNRLIDMGEIIKHEIDGNIYYGLPHSSLASAYWEHGEDYRDPFIKDIDSFLCQYATSGVSNGLSVILKAEKHSRLLSYIAMSGKLLEIVRKEGNSDNYSTLALIIVFKLRYFIFLDRVFFDSLGNIFFEKGEIMALNLIFSFENFGLFNVKKFWQQNKEKIINQLYDTGYFSEICGLLGNIGKANKKYMSEICKSINLNRLISKRSNGTYKIGELEDVLKGLSNIHTNVMLEFLNLIDKQKIIGKLYSNDNFSTVCSSLGKICRLNESCCLEIIEMIDYERLSKELGNFYNPTNTVSILTDLSKIDKSVMMNYWNRLDLQQFVIRPERSVGITESLGDLDNVARVEVLKFWRQYGLSKTIKRIEKAKAFRLLIDLCGIEYGGIDESYILDLLEHKEYKKCESTINLSDWLDSVVIFFTALSELNKDIALEYWHKLSKDDLAYAFQLQKASKIESNICRIFEANTDIGQEFWEKHLDIQKIAPKFCNTNGFWHIFCLAQSLEDKYPEGTREFCDEFVDYVPKLEEMLKKNKDEFSIMAFVVMLCQVKSQTSKKLRHLIDENIEGSAKQFIQQENMWGFYDDIIADVDLFAAKKLYKYYHDNLGIEKYIEKIKKSNSMERVERCFVFLSKVDFEVAAWT